MANSDIRIKLSADGTQVKNELRLIDKELQELGKSTTSNNTTTPHTQNQSQQSSTDRTNQNIQLRAQNLLIRELKSLRQEVSKLNDTYAKNNNTNGNPSSNNNNNGGGNNNNPPPSNNNGGGNNRNDDLASRVQNSVMSHLNAFKQVVDKLDTAYDTFQKIGHAAQLSINRQEMAFRAYSTTNTNGTSYSSIVHSAASRGRSYGYTSADVLSADRALIQQSGYRESSHQQDISALLKLSRVYSLDTNQTSSMAGRVAGMGNVRPEKFAKMIGTSVAENGMQGREQAQFDSIMSIINTLATKNVNVNEDTINKNMAMYNALVQTNPNLRGERGTSLVQRIDSLGDNNTLYLRTNNGMNYYDWRKNYNKNQGAVLSQAFEQYGQMVAPGKDKSQFTDRELHEVSRRIYAEMPELGEPGYIETLATSWQTGLLDKELEKAKNPNYSSGENNIEGLFKNFKGTFFSNLKETQSALDAASVNKSEVSAYEAGVLPNAAVEASGWGSGVSTLLGSGIGAYALSKIPGIAGGITRFGTGITGAGISGGTNGILQFLKGSATSAGSSAGTAATGFLKTALGKVAGVGGGIFEGINAYDAAKEGDTVSAILHGAMSGASLGGTIGAGFAGIGALPGAGIGAVGGALAGLLGSNLLGEESGVVHAATAPQDKTLSSTLLQDEGKERADRSNRMTEANTQALIDNTNALRGNKNNTKMVDETPTSAKKSQEDEKNKTLVDILRGNIPSKGRGGTWSVPSSSYTGSMGTGGISTGKAAYSQGKPIEGINAYNQWDDQWGDIVPTGWSGTLGSVGCTITAASMMHELYTGKTLTPGELAQDPNRPGSIADMLRYVGVQGRYIQNGGRDTEEEVWASLAAGRPVQGYYVNASTGNGVNMGRGTHAFVALGMNEDGTVKVLDPNGGKVTNISKEALTNNHEGTLDWYIPNADQEAQGLKKAQSHAQGLEYVPRDDYPAQLHKGERVLTKHEAEEFRNLPGLTTIPDSLRIDKNDGLYNAKMKHQLQKDYKEQSATTSSDPYFNAPRFDQGGAPDWNAVSGDTWLGSVWEEKYMTDYEKKKLKKAKLAEKKAKTDKEKENAAKELESAKKWAGMSRSKSSGFMESNFNTDRIAEAIREEKGEDQYRKYLDMVHLTQEKQYRYNLYKGEDYVSTLMKNGKSEEDARYFMSSQLGYIKEREENRHDTSLQSHLITEAPIKKDEPIPKPAPTTPPYTPKAGQVERVNPDGTLSHTESTTQNKPLMRAKLPGGGSISGGFVARNDGNTTTVGFGFGYQADPQQAVASQQRKNAYQQYLQKKSDQSRFNPQNKDPLVGAVTAAVNAPWKQAEHAMPRFNGKAMGNQMAQGMKLNKHAIIPKVSKHDFFKKSQDGSGYVMNPFGVQAGMQRFNQQRQQRAYQAMTGMSPQGAGMQGSAGGSQAQQLLAYSQSRGIGGALQGQGGSPNMQGGFSMTGQVRTQQGGNAQVVDPTDINRATTSGVMGLGGAVVSGVGNLFGAIGGLFGGGKGKKADKTPPNDGKNHNGLPGLIKKWGNTATDASKNEHDKMTTLTGDGTSLDTKTLLPTEPSKLGTKIPEKDGLDKIKPIKPDKTGKHSGLIGRWRNTAEEHNGAMNSLFAGTANTVETLGNGIGGIFGGLFGGKKKKNPDAADLPMGTGGKEDPLARINPNKDPLAGTSVENGAGGKHDVEVTTKVEIPEHITFDAKDPRSGQIIGTGTIPISTGDQSEKRNSNNNGFGRKALPMSGKTTGGGGNL